jgi:NAD(P)-dependent dehydrogenase (short-subunit alcohol dehydrogenase family)
MAPGNSIAESTERWVLVTGGSRGIGRAVVEDLARRGWNVAIAHLRDTASAMNVAARVEEWGSQAIVHTGNLGDAEECGRLVERLTSEVGRLDGLVHCAGLGALSPALDARPGRWRVAWDTHVGALLELLRQGHDLLAPGGAVVAMTSLGARRVMPGYATIAAAKGALETLVRYLSVEMADSDIAINAICGGPVETDSLRSFAFHDEVEETSRRSVAGRLGRPEDIAPIVAFLLGPDSRWIRGQVVVADGGLGLV